MSSKKIPPTDLQLKPINVFTGYGEFASEIIKMRRPLPDWETEGKDLKGVIGHFERLYIIYPEQNKHPSEQHQFIIDNFPHWLSLLAVDAYHHILIFTQSPYIIGSLNNLIQKDNAGLDKGLNFYDVGCWYFANGEFTECLEHELKLISTNSIDDVSNIIGREFSKYLYLDNNWKREEKIKELQILKYC